MTISSRFSTRSSLIRAIAIASFAFACAESESGPETRSTEAPSSEPSLAEATGTSVSARPVEWGYSGEDGPTRWASLSPAYAACAHDGTQSPIDLSVASDEKTGRIQLDYRPTSLRIAHHEHVTDIVDNGHTLQVTVEEGSQLTTDRDVYELKQFHFHTPSEHTVDGEHHSMEMHLVHQSASGTFAVVAGFFVEGARNENLQRLIEHFPAARGETVHRPDVTIDPAVHLAAEAPSYAYLGSFTTPPCTESVEWFLMRSPVTASRDQLAAFEAKLDHNNRPIQPTGSRAIGVAALARELAQ